jgi:hypothetical protein
LHKVLSMTCLTTEVKKSDSVLYCNVRYFVSRMKEFQGKRFYVFWLLYLRKGIRHVRKITAKKSLQREVQGEVVS